MAADQPNQLFGPTEKEINDRVIDLASGGMGGEPLLEEASRLLHCDIGRVREYVGQHYPGLLLIKRQAHRESADESPDQRQFDRNDRIGDNANDVYSLPSYKRRGGYRF